MAHHDNAPVALYIAAYSDENAAQADWNEIKRLAHDKLITIDGLVLVRRETDGTIHVKDKASDVGKGVKLGAVGGAVIGLIFPPALLASAAVGAGIGAGTGRIVDHEHKKEIKEDVEAVLPPGSSGIVALFEERFVTDVDKALGDADAVTRRSVDGASVQVVVAAVEVSG